MVRAPPARQLKYLSYNLVRRQILLCLGGNGSHGCMYGTSTRPGFRGKSIGDIISFRTLTDGRALRTASLSKLVLSASGGADRYNFFVSAGKSDDDSASRNARGGSTRGAWVSERRPYERESAAQVHDLAHILRTPATCSAAEPGTYRCVAPHVYVFVYAVYVLRRMERPSTSPHRVPRRMDAESQLGASSPPTQTCAGRFS